jgi:hypothetical protein
LFNANLNLTSLSIISYARTFHQFIVSTAQRKLWKYEFSSQPPIIFIHICGDHYVALFPETENTKIEERYTYFCEFMSDEKNEAFRDPIRVIPADKGSFAENQSPIFLD